MKLVKKILKVIGVLILVYVLVMPFVIDFLAFDRDKSSLLIGEEDYLRLLVVVKEINPNTSNAKLKFTLIDEGSSNLSDSLNSHEYQLSLYSGNSLLLSDGQLAYALDSRYHSENVKFSSPQKFTLGNVSLRKYTSDEIDIRIRAKPKGYFFPFDKYLMQMNFVLFDNKGVKRNPWLDIYTEDNRLFASKSIRNITGGRSRAKIPNSFITIFHRPNYISINFVLIIIISLLVIVWSLYRILSKTIVTAFEIIGLNISILVSFPTLRSILIPNNLEYAPLFDISSTIIWLLSLITIIIFFMRDLFLNKKK